MVDQQALDSPERYTELRKLIDSKSALKKWYIEVYQQYSECLEKCPVDGIGIELGSGAGFVKEILPDIVTTDVISYPGIDRVIDATEMAFLDRSLKAIFMMNVLHHIPAADRFFQEAKRCLKPGGRILIVDQYPGLWAKPILKYIHHEHFDDQTSLWEFPSVGPLSGANGALAWIIFFRDRALFEMKYPELKITRLERHSPLRYWMSGGLKKWTLLPGFLFPLATILDKAIAKFIPSFSSFVTIEITKSN